MARRSTLAASQFELEGSEAYSHVVSFTGPAAAEGRFPVGREEDAAKSMMSRYRGRTFATYLEGVRLPLSSAAPGFIGDVGAIRIALRYGHDDTREQVHMQDTDYLHIRQVHVDRHMTAEAPVGSATSDAAEANNRCVVVSGESGSGKTHAAIAMLRGGGKSLPDGCIGVFAFAKDLKEHLSGLSSEPSAVAAAISNRVVLEMRKHFVAWRKGFPGIVATSLGTLSLHVVIDEAGGAVFHSLVRAAIRAHGNRLLHDALNCDLATEMNLRISSVRLFLAGTGIHSDDRAAGSLPSHYSVMRAGPLEPNHARELFVALSKLPGNGDERANDASYKRVLRQRGDANFDCEGFGHQLPRRRVSVATSADAAPFLSRRARVASPARRQPRLPRGDPEEVDAS